jgi:small subunit ribosomal protein S16
MAVAIRLMRFGKRHHPTYRIVALDGRRKRDGSYIQKLGTYNPMVNPVELDIDQEKFDYWAKNGARISEGVRKLLKNR